MSIRVAGNVILLEGQCGLDDAERLLRVLLEASEAPIDWHNCADAHTAVIQLLVIAGREIRGTPRSDFLKDKIAPLLRDTNAH